MSKSNNKLLKFLKNKYFLASFFFVLWLIFFDQNNLIDRVVALKKYYEMEDEKQFYIEKIKIDSHKLNELRTDRDNLEKFAREQYFMKRDNEDIFVLE